MNCCPFPKPVERFGKIHCRNCKTDINTSCCIHPRLTVRFGKVFCKNCKTTY